MKEHGYRDVEPHVILLKAIDDKLKLTSTVAWAQIGALDRDPSGSESSLAGSLVQSGQSLGCSNPVGPNLSHENFTQPPKAALETRIHVIMKG